MNKKNQKGFTLVELIVVIAIVAILAAVGIVGYSQFISNARNSKAKAELDQVVNVLYAQAVANGIRISDTNTDSETDSKKVTIVDTGGVEVVSVKGGKIELKTDKAHVFEALLREFAQGFEGEFYVADNFIHYKVGGGEGKTEIVNTKSLSILETGKVKVPVPLTP